MDEKVQKTSQRNQELLIQLSERVSYVAAGVGEVKIELAKLHDETKENFKDLRGMYVNRDEFNFLKKQFDDNDKRTKDLEEETRDTPIIQKMLAYVAAAFVGAIITIVVSRFI